MGQIAPSFTFAHRLSGTIPATITGLTGLTYQLELKGNSLYGARSPGDNNLIWRPGHIPDLAAFTTLTGLDLRENRCVARDDNRN